jgi:hypothetical protein
MGLVYCVILRHPDTGRAAGGDKPPGNLPEGRKNAIGFLCINCHNALPIQPDTGCLAQLYQQSIHAKESPCNQLNALPN